MDSTELLKSITNQFYTQSNEHILYLSLSAGLMKDYKNAQENDVVFIDLAKELTPLKPFLNILESLKISEKDLKKYCYALQYETFLTFLKNKDAVERGDVVVAEEISYEKIRISETIVQLISNFFTGKIVVLNTQLISGLSIEILKELAKASFSGKLTLCFDSMKVDAYSAEVKDFLQQIGSEKNYFAITSADDLSKMHFGTDHSVKFSFENLSRYLKNARLFLDIDESYRFVKIIDSSNCIADFEPQEARKLYYEMGLTCFYHEDMDMATFYLNAVIETPYDDELELYTLYYLAQVSCKKNMNAVALRYINKAISRLKKTPDLPLYALAMMAEYIITEKTDSEYSTEKYFNALNLLEKQGFINNRIYTSLMVPYGVIYERYLRRQMLEKVKSAKDAAEQLGNKFGLSTACHWMGILMTHEGKKEEALSWYNKSLALRKEIGEISSITKITNGLSYEYLIDSNYKQSYQIVNGFINSLLVSKDFPEIIITLYNVARTLFYSHNFDAAYDIFQSIINLMVIFDLQDFSITAFMPEYNDILVYKANIDFFRGDITRAKINLNNILNNGRSVTLIEDVLKYFLQACLELEDGNAEASEKAFDECHSFFKKVGHAQEHRMAFMCYEYAKLLSEKGFNSKADFYVKTGFNLAKEYNLPYYTKNKDFATLADYTAGFEQYEPLNINLRALEERAEKERLVNQLHKRLRDSQFLNKLVTTNVTNLSDLHFANNIVQSIFDYTMAEAVFLAEKTEGGWTPLATAMREEFATPSARLWNSVLTSEKSVEVVPHKTDADRLVALVNLSKFEFTGGIIIYLQKKTQLSAEELSILNIAASSIQAQLVMLKQNEHLTILSSTDQLSMLNNRRALQEHLGLESEMIRRYEKKRQMYLHESISFIDLDNFKYYNDTFGHEAGDLLIVQFSKLLKRIYRKVDFVARFGGDEFVVVLPNTSCTEAKRAAERLQEGLEEAHHFVPDLERLLNKKLEIPQNRLLGFSMGICANSDGTDLADLQQAMINADHALYYSKQNQKGTVTIWTDIKDKLVVDEALSARAASRIEVNES